MSVSEVDGETLASPWFLLPTLHSSALQCNIAVSPVQQCSSTVQEYSVAVQCSAVQCSAVQFSAMQHCSVAIHCIVAALKYKVAIQGIGAVSTWIISSTPSDGLRFNAISFQSVRRTY